MGVVFAVFSGSTLPVCCSSHNQALISKEMWTSFDYEFNSALKCLLNLIPHHCTCSIFIFHMWSFGLSDDYCVFHLAYSKHDVITGQRQQFAYLFTFMFPSSLVNPAADITPWFVWSSWMRAANKCVHPQSL